MMINLENIYYFFLGVTSSIVQLEGFGEYNNLHLIYHQKRNEYPFVSMKILLI